MSNYVFYEQTLFKFEFLKFNNSIVPNLTIFLQYDPEGFGEIPWDDFVEVLKTPEFVAEVAPNKRDILAERAQERKTPAITFQDFVNIVRIN